MNEPKPFASLTSGLLARKGSAKPAMRPQGFGQGFGLDDLGWNDMGHGGRVEPALEPEDLPEHVPSSIAALTPAPKNDAPVAPTEKAAEEIADEAPASPVIEQQRAIEASFSAPEPAPAPAPAPAPVVRLPERPRQERGAKGKAAFTLRLDMDRHLKLRLACAVTNRSAQQIVTTALDQYLGTLPELDSLANQVPAKLGKRS